MDITEKDFLNPVLGFKEENKTLETVFTTNENKEVNLNKSFGEISKSSEYSINNYITLLSQNEENKKVKEKNIADKLLDTKKYLMENKEENNNIKDDKDKFSTPTKSRNFLRNKFLSDIPLKKEEKPNFNNTLKTVKPNKEILKKLISQPPSYIIPHPGKQSLKETKEYKKFVNNFNKAILEKNVKKITNFDETDDFKDEFKNYSKVNVFNIEKLSAKIKENFNKEKKNNFLFSSETVPYLNLNSARITSQSNISLRTFSSNNVNIRPSSQSKVLP